MHIVHIALQGCLRSEPVAYGITTDTGGHIRYLLDLVRNLEEAPGVERQTIITRGFHEPRLDSVHARPRERLSERTEIVRLFGAVPGYLAKEELYADMPALTAAFLAHLGEAATAGRLPDVCHAHYADAGTLAFAAKAEYGIPFIFTAHSLGRVKRQLMPALGEMTIAADGNALARREAVEDQAIGAADLIVASSRDEAEGQYARYPSARPERIRINPPGCFVGALQRPVDRVTARAVRERIDGLLDDPARPMILALARPVVRKNLPALVRAYAGEPWLRENANLVVFAGSAHDAALASPENRAVLDEVRALVAGQRLCGRVALPAHHAPQEVPAIYAHARARGGVFANPALHEPFGLTIIEAAAAGLPVVTTDRGGPRDILADCRHGLLVDPFDERAIGDALRQVLSDGARYERFATAGPANVGRYTWQRHARLYVRDARRLLRPRRRRVDRVRHNALFLTDIDGTLIGCREGLTALDRWRAAHPSVLFGVATGRSLHDATAVLVREGVPPPSVMVTSVGSEIYYTTDEDYGVVRDDDWSERIAEDWDDAGVADLLADDARLTPQPPMEQRRFKRSYFASLNEGEVAAIDQRLRAHGLPATVIYSHNKFLDILPRRASKGEALRWLAQRFAIPSYATAAAGDSGNDADMLVAAARGIVVANHGSELAPILTRSSVRLSRASHAGGIVEQIEGWPPLETPAQMPLLATGDAWSSRGSDRV